MVRVLIAWHSHFLSCQAWVGSEDSGAFSGPDYTAGSIFQLGSCTFGCQVPTPAPAPACLTQWGCVTDQVWDSLSLMWDPTTHRLWCVSRFIAVFGSICS